MTKPNKNKKRRLHNPTRMMAIGLASLLALVVFAAKWGAETEPAEVALDTTGTPILQLDRDYVDFGDVPFNQMVEATFEVTNTGNATLLFAEEPFIELKDGC